MGAFLRTIGTLLFAVILMFTFSAYGNPAGFIAALFGGGFMYIGGGRLFYNNNERTMTLQLGLLVLGTSILCIVTLGAFGTLLALSSCAGAIIGWGNTH
jgi:glucose uptake protein GlcU